MKKLIKYILIVLLLWFVGHVAYLVYDGTRPLDRYVDVAVVLGNKVNEDGTLSQRLSQRLDRAVELYREKKVGHILVSGGLGKEGFYEGDKMKEYLVDNNIPDSVIIVDNKGNNTESTVENAMLICKEYDLKTIVVVSQYFHITRTKMLFRRAGVDDVEGASPSFFEWRDLYAIPREFVAFYYTWIKPN